MANKNITQFSGRTSAYLHKHIKWKDKDYSTMPKYLTDGKLDWNKVPHGEKSAIQATTIFEAQWSDCPVEVEEEVKQLWRDNELGNDTCYYNWNIENENESDGADGKIKYPLIRAYLKSKKIKKCLIHWWW